MHIAVKPLKPLSGIELTQDERKIISWIKSANWEPQRDARPPIPYRAKLPEFFGGVRFYNMQAGSSTGSSYGAVELLIKKMEYQGVITKQDMYPVATIAGAKYLSLKKADLDNLGLGREEEDE